MRVTKAIKAEQLKLLQEHYFDAKPALEYTNEFELLVAVVLLSLIHILPEVLAKIVRPNDLVITMGAGSINQYGPKLLAILAVSYTHLDVYKRQSWYYYH